MAQGRATVPALTVAKHEGRTGHGTRHEARTTARKERMKEQTNTNDSSKISEVNGKDEPCRGLATPIIFLYIDIRVYGVGRRGT